MIKYFATGLAAAKKGTFVTASYDRSGALLSVCRYDAGVYQGVILTIPKDLDELSRTQMHDLHASLTIPPETLII